MKDNKRYPQKLIGDLIKELEDPYLGDNSNPDFIFFSKRRRYGNGNK